VHTFNGHKWEHHLHNGGVAVLSRHEEDDELIGEEEELARKESIPLEVVDRLQSVVFSPKIPEGAIAFSVGARI
jgi:hypothetical protein